MTSVNSKVIVALDYNNSEAALKLAGRLDPQQCRLKVGKELFTAAGARFDYYPRCIDRTRLGDLLLPPRLRLDSQACGSTSVS